MEEIYLNPIERKEFFLAKLGGQEVTPPDAVTRIERYLQDIIDGNASTIPPVTRIEYYLAKISGANVDVPDPVTRTEYYLAKIAGMDVEPPDPITRLDYFLQQWANDGPGEVVETVTGTLPLTLANALSNAIVSLTRYGLCTQNGTPTPSAPVDIKCNNGALRMVDDELPAAYKRVLGFTCNNNAMWQIAGFHLRGSDTVRTSFSVSAACNVFGCYQGADATDNYDLYVSTTSGSKYLRYGNGTYLSYWSAGNLDQRFDVVFTPTGTTGMPQDSTWTEATFESANDLLIGSTTTTGTSSKLKGNLYGDFIVENGGAERLHLVPCERLSDNVLGYYDLVGEAFYDPYTGFDGAVSLGYDGSHSQLSVVGTPEVLTVRGKNLINSSTNVVGQFIKSNGSIGADADQSNPNSQYTDLIPVMAGEKYTWSLLSNRTSSGNNRWHEYDATGTWIREKYHEAPAVGTNVPFTKTAAASSDAVYVRLSYSANDADVMFEQSSAATAYQPYITPQTASAVNLLSAGDYKDEQEIISGTVHRKVGTYVFDGTETFGSSSAYGTALYINAFATRIGADRSVSPLCTHFVGGVSSGQQPDGTVFFNASGHLYFRTTDSATDFKAFLKDQYDAGTPVILVFALATGSQTTESVTAQHLATNEGTNVVDATAEVGPLSAEVKYVVASAQDVLSKLLGMKVTKQDISTKDAEDMIDIIIGEEKK